MATSPHPPSSRERAIARARRLERRIGAFDALPEEERRILGVIALFPCPIWRHFVVQMNEVVSLRTRTRALDHSRLDRLGPAWQEAGLVEWDGSQIRCEPDVGTYLVRLIADTPFGAAIRQSVTANVAWRIALEDAADASIYNARLMRLCGRLEQAGAFATQALGYGGRVSRVATLFGPADPWFVPTQVAEWQRLLPQAIGHGVRMLENSGWYLEFFEALAVPASDDSEVRALLLPEDALHSKSLRRVVSARQLESTDGYRNLWYTWQLFQGNEDLVRERARLHAAAGFHDAEAFVATLELSQGDLSQSLERFERACFVSRKNSLATAQLSWAGMMRILGLLASQAPAHLQLATELIQKLIRKKGKYGGAEEPTALARLADFSAWLNGTPLALGRPSQRLSDSPISVLVALLVLAWQRPDDTSIADWMSIGERLRALADSLSHRWFVRQLDAVLERLRAISTDSDVLPTHSQPDALVDLVIPKATWELALDSLGRIADSAAPLASGRQDTAEGATRIAWLVCVRHNRLYAEPRLQSKRGSTFSRGRAIALERLVGTADEGLPLTASDAALAAHITRSVNCHGQPEFILNPMFVLAMVGHPHVFDQENESLRYEVKRGQVRLRCLRMADGSHRLTLEPPIEASAELPFAVQSGTDITVYESTSNLRKVTKLIGGELVLPAEAGSRLQLLLPRLSAFVPTSANLDLDETVPTTQGDTTPVLRVLPRAESLRVQILVTPFGPSGPACHPGDGDETLSDYCDGQSRHVRRDLAEELNLAQALTNQLPCLGEISDGFEWTAHGLLECLSLVSEISQLTDSAARVEWPEGEPLKLRRMRSMRVSITRGDAARWFEADGTVQLSDDSELRVLELLERMHRAEGRFVELSKGDYAELSQSAIEQLRLLEAFRARSSDDEKLRVAPWLALALPEPKPGEFVETGSEVWQAWRRRVASISKQTATTTSQFLGTLRDYQIAGFEWLSRMAALGTGVCLADDMGLGKTIQALALLQYRATRRLSKGELSGPALIVAPASVCPGWLTEAARFTPNLKMRWLTGSDRNLDDLTRKSVVVCTYEILYRDRDALCAVIWDTVVLDEAHHIKNAHTQRARAAYSLQAGFRLATTGTPIENHLGELWSLYRFLMPGLLGEQHEFVERFRSPIENLRDAEKRKQLQALVHPFLLRRTKQQVLSELPPRTEMVRQIEMSQAEIELYEAIRQRGLLALDNPSKDRNQQRVRVLAELMRLRRACCHPRLVLKDSEIQSSKLATLLELVEELRDAGHRALVFSQFVDHLTLVREALDDQGIAYQYLDGSTPVTDRAKRVEAFQAGEGELFLISLRAGGTGLNLTAADYVIHLDPWWNPAVEDQASDRAHRIGQERPVTIYRLVTRGTIEERLVSMHAEKRTLAADILEGTEGSKRLDPDELLSLLREASLSMTTGTTGSGYVVTSHPQ